MCTSQVYFGGRLAALHGSKRSCSCIATIWWRSGDWKNYSPSIEELCCKFSIIFWPNLFRGDGDVSFFFYPSCQRFFDTATVEGLSLIVQGLLTVVLPNQEFLCWLLWLLIADQCVPRKTSFGTFTQWHKDRREQAPPHHQCGPHFGGHCDMVVDSWNRNHTTVGVRIITNAARRLCVWEHVQNCLWSDHLPLRHASFRCWWSVLDWWSSGT